jgi:HEPN domain-containing protein
VCFHCQQCAEKYLKALLVEAQLFVPKIHDLVKLRDPLLSIHVSLAALERGLNVLNEYAVDIRYPEFFPSKRDARSAFRWAGQIRLACRRLLRLRERRKQEP